MLITFEGIDGSGKSTQAALVRDRLASLGFESLLVREPGGTGLSERIRELLLDSSHPIHPFAELLLFSAARAQLCAERIRPALEDGAVVLCDRFFDSTTAYQGAGRGVADPAWLRDFHGRVTGGLVPDRTYLFRLPVETARARRAERAEDRMEQAGGAFHRSVADGYDAIARAEPARFLVVDARATVEAQHAFVWSDLARLLGIGTPGARPGNGLETT